MARTRLLFGGFLALAVGALPVDARAADAVGTTAIRGQLRLLFKSWDLNNDGYLDRAELARAFRGARAKPYQPEPPAKDKGGKDGKPDFSKYPDYAFLIELDQNGDGKVSRKEFESWARDFAAERKKQLQAESRLLQAEAKLQQAAAGKDAHLLQAEVKKEQAAVKQYETQQKAFEKHILEQLKQQQKQEAKHAKP